MTGYVTMGGVEWSDGATDEGRGVRHLANGGHRDNLVPMFAAFVAEAQAALDAAQAAQDHAEAAGTMAAQVAADKAAVAADRAVVAADKAAVGVERAAVEALIQSFTIQADAAHQAIAGDADRLDAAAQTIDGKYADILDAGRVAAAAAAGVSANAETASAAARAAQDSAAHADTVAAGVAANTDTAQLKAAEAAQSALAAAASEVAAKAGADAAAASAASIVGKEAEAAASAQSAARSATQAMDSATLATLRSNTALEASGSARMDAAAAEFLAGQAQAARSQSRADADAVRAYVTAYFSTNATGLALKAAQAERDMLAKVLSVMAPIFSTLADAATQSQQAAELAVTTHNTVMGLFAHDAQSMAIRMLLAERAQLLAIQRQVTALAALIDNTNAANTDAASDAFADALAASLSSPTAVAG